MSEMRFSLPEVMPRENGDSPRARGLAWSSPCFFDNHNAEVRALWQAFHENRHTRIPVRLNTNPRVLMLDPAYNTAEIDYETYSNDPEVMADVVLAWQYFVRFLLPGDHEQGPPEAWPLTVHWDNIYDAAWLGCPVHYRDAQVPDTTPILDDEHKHMLFDQGIPKPFAGDLAERTLRFMEHWEAKAEAGWTFMERPVAPQRMAPFIHTDGPMTLAIGMRGAENFLTDLMVDPEYARQLLDYLTEALVQRMAAWRRELGTPMQQDDFGFGDDACEFISEAMYREFVLPHHRRLYNTFSSGKGRFLHLCGDAQHLFDTTRRELDIGWFDTGFPIDFDRLRRELGPETVVSGGPRVAFFLEDDAEPLLQETARILQSDILNGGLFVLQEGNNLPPRVPLDRCWRFYEFGKTYGTVP
ncbi:MAG: uroporphyrinogen decarboxylase family protein [Candidatus Hydrogenedentota bacterium]